MGGRGMLEALGLVKGYGPVNALDDFTLAARPGEIVGLVGHNGAGKTTFANIVSGLLRPDGGRVLVDGKAPGAARRLLGLAPQHIALYPTVTPRETLRLFGGLQGLRRRELGRAVTEIAEALRITDFLDRRVGVLSGGQQRRVQAAAAMVHRPALLLLDEPTAGVDPETRQSLLEVVRDHARTGAAVVYTTHYLPELTDLGASIAVARHGRVIARGEAGELLHGLPGEVRLTFDDEEMRVPTTDPAATLATMLVEATKPVRSVDLSRPTLDDLYRAVVRAH
ncbi:ABC transporter ATP-binding protein [Streptomonospora nanhaiensis]|uniref:ABC transporter ATP-binding protein n=1 Tax=Streptomonospora nanhaiensis TaxID=1323731 RepID=A0ABY6YG95_9ACTN|nr:ABC transporter ATP-binding protein [Streptomonospora nanhaiensis]WAE71287.1 ABC transporter ATP-binding protein [Streptomonospora nanhaiensis]